MSTPMRTRSPYVVMVAALVAVLAAGVVWHTRLEVADGQGPRWGWTGLYAWTPIPERMRSDEIAAIFSGVPYSGPVEPRLRQLDQIQAEHPEDRDVLVLAAYVYATLTWSPRATEAADLRKGRQAATKLLDLARQDPDRYGYFVKCANHLLASCEMLEPPRSAEGGKARLTALLDQDAATDAVAFSMAAVLSLIEEKEGPQACFPFLQHLADAYPATLTALYCWKLAAFRYEAAGDLTQVVMCWEQCVPIAEQIGDPRLVRAAQGAADSARKRAAAAAARGHQP